MTWTIFEFNAPSKEVDETAEHYYDSYGYDGTTHWHDHVLVNASVEEAVDWWQQEFGENPRRYYRDSPVWTVRERESAEEAAAEVGTVDKEAGGIGVPMTRATTMDELRKEDHVLVVEAEDV